MSSSSNAAKLLASVEPLAYKQRQRTLARRARELAAAGEVGGVLDELARMGWYGRRVGLSMAVVARDVAYVERAFTDPDPSSDPTMRITALGAARLLPVSDEALAAALDDAPAAVRQAVYRTVVVGRRRALAERLLAGVRERWGDREAAALLPACGPETVRRWLPELAHLGVGSMLPGPMPPPTATAPPGSASTTS